MEERRERSVPSPVVKSKANLRKEKKFVDKIHDDFIKQDLKTAIEAEWHNNIVPGIVETGLNIARRVFLDGDSFKTAAKKSIKIGGSSFYDYNSTYRTRLASSANSNPRTSESARGSSYRIGTIYVSSRAEAQEINEEMASRIQEYGSATCQDLFSLCGITRTNHQDNKWGWTSAMSFRFRPSGEEWILDYDAPEYLG